MNTRTIRVILPRDLVNKVDEVARRRHRNRSELICVALRIYLQDRKNAWHELYRVGERAIKEMGIKSEEEIDKIVYDYRHSPKAT